MKKATIKYIFKEAWAIIPSTKDSASRTETLGDSSGNRSPKTFFGLRWPRLLQNLV
jgi:hypothetical protein